MSSDEQRPRPDEDVEGAEDVQGEVPEASQASAAPEGTEATADTEGTEDTADQESPADTDAVEDGADEQAGSDAPSPWPKRTVFGAAALALAALVTAAVFGIQWWSAAASDNVELAESREDVIRVGAGAVKAFTQLDYTKPDEFFDSSAAVSTKELADQINKSREANKKQMLEAKTVATTDVLDIAVDELNTHEGKARFLAAIKVTVKQGDKSSEKPMRIEVEMTRVGQEWKVSGISQVPVVGAPK